MNNPQPQVTLEDEEDNSVIDNDAIDSHLDEIKQLIASGDVVLAQYRQTFYDQIGRQTILSDEQLTRYIASEVDDCDPAYRAKYMEAFESSPYKDSTPTK